MKHIFGGLSGLCLLLASLAFSMANAQSSLNDGLVAYYPLNGNANDASGTHHGTVHGASLTADRFGNANQAYSFDGATSFIELPENDAFDSQNYTVSLWFNAAQLPDAADHAHEAAMLISRGRNDFEVSIGAPPFTNTGIRFLPRLLNSNTGQAFDAPTANVAASKWTHLVAIYQDASKSARIFLNGLELALNNFTGPDGAQNPVPARMGMRYDGSVPFHGSLDSVRIYNRALSTDEVATLYDYEKTPPTPQIHAAAATAQTINGFVVGINVNDGGYGYTNTPAVRIVGGGGSGAEAVATMVNGVVTAITVKNAGSGYSGIPTVEIDLPPFPPKRAVATATVANGFLVDTALTDPGYGYAEPPVVLVVGGGGSGAVIVAEVAHQVVTGFRILNAGSGYTGAPRILIAAPPFAPSLYIAVSKVTVTLKVNLGKKYQLESTADLKTWSPIGDPFVAQDELLVQEFSVKDTGQVFRIRQTP